MVVHLFLDTHEEKLQLCKQGAKCNYFISQSQKHVQVLLSPPTAPLPSSWIELKEQSFKLDNNK